jgi:hypothetical protein
VMIETGQRNAPSVAAHGASRGLRTSAPGRTGL